MPEPIRFRALDIKRSLGVRHAAGYLRRRGVSLCDALVLLAGSRRAA